MDLLLCMAKAAANSVRAKQIFVPFPHLVDPLDKRKAGLTPADPDFAKLKRILDVIPSIRTLSNATDLQSMRQTLDAREPLAYPLLQWLISSNRCVGWLGAAVCMRVCVPDTGSCLFAPNFFKYVTLGRRMAVDRWWLSANRRYRGGREFREGRISPLRKVEKFSPWRNFCSV